MTPVHATRASSNFSNSYEFASHRWRSTARHSLRRPPAGQRAAGLQRVYLRIQQLGLHQEFADRGLQPTVVVVHRLGRSALQAGLARRHKPIAPLRGPRRRDAQLPRHRLEILTPQQAEHRRAFTPGRTPPLPVTRGGRASRPPGSPPPPPNSDRASSSRHASCENFLAIKCPRKP